MNAVFRFVRLVRVIIARGKLRHSGHDFQARRLEALQDLTAFCPPAVRQTAPPAAWKKVVFRNAVLRGLWSQVAFIISRLKRRGGHLCAGTPSLCYIRNPRAASTTLSRMMLEARFPQLKNLSLTAETLNFLTDVNLQRTLPTGKMGTTFFTVVRNPFARIVSVYHEFFERAQRNFIYEDYLFGILRREMSFPRFLRTLLIIPDALKDQHFRPQHLALKYYSGVPVTVLRLEEPEALARFLAPRGMKPEAINVSTAAYDYRAYYDTATAEVARRLYEKDIALFGYEWACRELMGHS